MIIRVILDKSLFKLLIQSKTVVWLTDDKADDGPYGLLYINIVSNFYL